jgi:CheY-like chemotaxis protein
VTRREDYNNSGRFKMEFAPSAAVAPARATDIADPSLILILSDINMPGMSGLEMLPTAHRQQPIFATKSEPRTDIRTVKAAYSLGLNFP